MPQEVIQFDLAKGAALRRELVRRGFAIRQIQHAVFSATLPGIAVTLLKRGKLVIQGKDPAGFARDALGAWVDTTKTGTTSSSSEGRAKLEGTILGTDESGKGDYFGPLVVAGVLVPAGDEERMRSEGVADCKELSDGEVVRLAAWVEESWVSFKVSLQPAEYNRRYLERRNLNHLLAELHAEVILEVTARHLCDAVLTDQFGDESLVKNALGEIGEKIRLFQWPGAESTVAVAAASIVARAEFLRSMDTLSRVVGQDLPKGASLGVEDAARELVRREGRAKLEECAKVHFKTTQKIESLFDET